MRIHVPVPLGRTLALSIALGLTLTIPAGLARDDEAPGSRGSEKRAVDLGRFVEELGHPELARREAATRSLIEAGHPAARRVRNLCDAEDPKLRLRARRIFGAVHGVPPETYDRVQQILTSAQGGEIGVPDAASRLREISAAAVDLALRRLEPRANATFADPLYVELRVREALDRIASGQDEGDSAHATVLEHGGAGAPALLRIAQHRGADIARRSHALWLYALVTGAERGEGLRSLLRDPEPIVRDEALLAVSETLRRKDFVPIARALGARESEARERVAAAASRHLDVDALRGFLGSRQEEVAGLAAIALGKTRDGDALEALVARSDNERRPAVRAALAGALGEFRHEKGVKALAEMYPEEKDASVRASIVAALRPRPEVRRAAIVLATALFDDDEGVRLLAADGMVGRSGIEAAPALIQAALADRSGATRARMVSGLRTLLTEDAPFPVLGKDRAEQAWRQWLVRNRSKFPSDRLPWFKDSLDAARIVDTVRERVEDAFFYFDDPGLVARERLHRVAVDAMKKLLAEKEAPRDPLEASDFEKSVLGRLLASTAAKNPETLLAALGGIPFETEVSDLVRMTNAAAEGMVDSLGDRFSSLTPSNDPEGKLRPGWLPGLLDDSDRTNGFLVEEREDSWWVEFVLYDTPAWYAGIQPGDQIVRIDKKFPGEMTRREILDAINEEHDFWILRDGWNRPYALHLVPDVADDSRIVTAAVLPGKIGYLRLKMFATACSVKVEKALVELESQGIVGLVLDLRNNPGGTVIDATEIVDKFLPAGKLISVNVERDADGELEEDEVRSTASDRDREYPLAVLVNGSSASASEMTSGSLQGNERAVIVGETTYGKGIGQMGQAIPGFSSDTALGTTQSVYALTLTMMRYYLPEGKRSIHHVGVEPDLPVRERDLKGSLLDKVMRVRQGEALGEYVTELLEDDRELAIRLARFDGEDPERYPDFSGFYRKAKRYVSEQEARRIVREELRRRLLPDAEEAAFERIFYDLQEDRTLRAGIRAVAEDADVDLSGLEEYGVW